jgi:hypothetical protein
VGIGDGSLLPMSRVLLGLSQQGSGESLGRDAGQGAAPRRDLRDGFRRPGRGQSQRAPRRGITLLSRKACAIRAGVDGGAEWTLRRLPFPWLGDALVTPASKREDRRKPDAAVIG